MQRNVLKLREVFEGFHPGSIPARLQPNAGNDFRKVVRGRAFEIVVREHLIENGGDAVVADVLDMQANGNCKAGVDLSPIPVRACGCQLSVTLRVQAISLGEVEIQVERVSLPRGDAEFGFYNGTLVSRLERHIHICWLGQGAHRHDIEGACNKSENGNQEGSFLASPSC